jgi:hypothetical protein
LKLSVAKLHKQWLQGQKNKDKALVLLYTNGSKRGEEVAAGYCAISAQGKYTKERNISLRGKLEIMDAKLAVIY